MIDFKEIKTITEISFSQAMEIYTNSFAENQRLSLEIIMQRTQEDKYQKILGGFLGDQVVLMAILHFLKETNCILLAYLATKEGYRGQGIGRKFFPYILEQVRKKNQYLILEVEDPAFAKDEIDQTKRRQRIEFYRSNGAVEMKGVNYILPPLVGDISTEMKLLIMPPYSSHYIEGNLVKKIIKQIYAQVYSRNKNDPFLTQFIDTIEGEVELI